MTQRIALINDIQGNAVALETILRQLAGSVDQIVCLGDLVTGPEPIRVLRLMRQHDVISVRGNMDEVVLNPPTCTGDDESEQKYAEIDAWCAIQLTHVDRVYLEELPLSVSVSVGHFEMVCCHGSPQSNTDVIDVTTSDNNLENMLSDTQAHIVATGHMHLPMLRYLDERLLINPGSVGLPSGGKRLMPTRAEYAVITFVEGTLSVAFHRIEYPFADFERRLMNSNMPHSKWYLSKWT